MARSTREHDAGATLTSHANIDERLTGARVLARNTIWNLVGQAAPLAAVLIAVPPLVRGLGTDRFGVLTIAWMVAGYFSLFDLGLGWAVTRKLSEKLASARHDEIPPLVWTSLTMLLGLGVLGGAALAAATPLIVHRLLHLPHGLESETSWTFYLLALSVPMIVTTAGLTGMLAAHQRFGLINALRLPMSVVSYLGPLALLPFSRRLEPVVGILVLSRLVATLVSFGMCLRTMPELRGRFACRSSLVPELLGFGGWITVSNVVGPLMVYLDRVVVGGLLGVTAVAYYATPFDLSSRLWVLSSPVVAVLFPAFAATSTRDPQRMARLFTHGLRYAFLVLFPCALVLATFAREGLRWWLGGVFAAQSTHVLQWLAAGMFVNGLAQVALALVQSVGKPSWSARLHLAELPLYLAGLWWLIRVRGIEGAAIAWVARASLDALVLFIMSGTVLRGHAWGGRQGVVALALALAALTSASLLEGWLVKAAFLAVVLSIVAITAWRVVVVPARRGLAPRLVGTQPS